MEAFDLARDQVIEGEGRGESFPVMVPICHCFLYEWWGTCFHSLLCHILFGMACAQGRGEQRCHSFCSCRPLRTWSRHLYVVDVTFQCKFSTLIDWIILFYVTIRYYGLIILSCFLIRYVIDWIILCHDSIRNGLNILFYIMIRCYGLIILFRFLIRYLMDWINP